MDKSDNIAFLYQYIESANPEAEFLEGHDNAILGVATIPRLGECIAYSTGIIVNNLYYVVFLNYQYTLICTVNIQLAKVRPRLKIKSPVPYLLASTPLPHYLVSWLSNRYVGRREKKAWAYSLGLWAVECKRRA